MQIDPENKVYTEATDEELEKILDEMKENDVVAFSVKLEKLQKLQADLEKAGYKKDA